MPELNATSAATAAMIRSACDTTLPEILQACYEAGQKVGGRFTFTIQYSAEKDELFGYVVRWFKPSPYYGFEDTEAVGTPGTGMHCIQELQRYVEKKQAQEAALKEPV